MLTFFSQYPYLSTNLITLFFVHLTGIIFLKPPQRSAILFSGLINTTCFPFLIFLEAEYWQPVRIGGGPLGFEDALCSYDVAALLWLILSFNLNAAGFFKIQWPVLLRRFLLLGLLIGSVFIAGCLLGMRGMTSLIATQLVILPLLYWLKPESWPLTLRGMLFFPLIYFLIVKVYFMIWPHFVAQWNPAGPWGRLIGGIPLGEYIWAVGFTLWWPPFFTHICNLELVRDKTNGLTLRPLRTNEANGANHN